MPGALMHTLRLARAGLVLGQHGVRFIPKGTPGTLATAARDHRHRSAALDHDHFA